MKRFLECARTGQHRTASTGEVAAFQLARQVRSLADLLSDMDDGLKEEFLEVLRTAAFPDTRTSILKLLP